MTTISQAYSTPSSGTLPLGTTVTISVFFSNGVVVHGSPTLTLNDGEVATFVSQGDGYEADFKYVVQSVDRAAPLAVTGINFPNGSSVIDYSGNPVSVGNINLPLGVSIDADKPVFSQPVTDITSGVVKSGSAINISVTGSQYFTVVGTPTITLNDGGTAVYNSILSTGTKLVFTQVVGGFDMVPSGSNLSITSVSLPVGASVKDGFGLAVDLSSLVGQVSSGSVVIDGTVPQVLQAITSPSSGTLTTGQTYTITVPISEPVKITGDLSLSLNDGGVATLTTNQGFGLVFTETVQPGENASQLAITGVNVSGSVTDVAGVDVDFSPVIGAVKGSLAISAPGTLTPTPTSTPTPTPISAPTAQPGLLTPATVLPVYRFFDSNNGTHFFTSDTNEKNSILATRHDLLEETNGYGAVPAGSDGALSVYRFFDTIHGTQFITSSATERDQVIAGRPDLTYEPQGTFYEHSSQQTGDVAIYRFFDTKLGTHFYTGNATEANGLQQPGGSNYRPDLKSEGIAFYAPAGNFT